ncbi:hypothetical protein ICN28_01100 [Polynucleobacter sp. 30F-ANTBAC]|jgi:hypothetical protein|nr:hypothetical protein [Polynucleobacter sp. 30F-ANTBAC]
MFLKKLPLLMLLPLALSGCDRNDYVTWHCKVDPSNHDEKPLRMILEGSTMSIDQHIYKFCGSLGPQSYFDLNCSGKADNSAITFSSKTGIWTKGPQTLSCVSL